ncbi:UDP-N-acetylglucosamine 2-epimerase [Streptomyces sp. NPDC012950]|uniref:UDP-N-acetylglucosamine 2-epimerase n=1 Tax=Streptomyces sp. NPDC012950 TaxID=3364858 RepID=UPI0036763F85
MTRGGAGAAVVLGTRPEVVKPAGVIRGPADDAWVVHTGQHYDDALSTGIFRGLGLPEPRVTLRGTGGGPRAAQRGSMIGRLAGLFEDARPSVVVQGGHRLRVRRRAGGRLPRIDVLHVYRLTADCTAIDALVKKLWDGRWREAPRCSSATASTSC